MYLEKQNGQSLLVQAIFFLLFFSWYRWCSVHHTIYMLDIWEDMLCVKVGRPRGLLPPPLGGLRVLAGQGRQAVPSPLG